MTFWLFMIIGVVGMGAMLVGIPKLGIPMMIIAAIALTFFSDDLPHHSTADCVTYSGRFSNC